MASKFDSAFNKFAKMGTSINRGANKIIGKEVFQDIREIEQPRDFPPYSEVPAYPVPEPDQWPVLHGSSVSFSLNGSKLHFSENLDSCMRYRPYFKESADYYTQQFKYKYQNCVQDFDSFISYFSDLYLEGLNGMALRANSLLLLFGIFTANVDNFVSRHMNSYREAIDAYETMVGIEAKRNQSAENLGNSIGGAVHLRGGGFGIKGAMKGVAKAEAFNAGMSILGKYIANQTKMTQEEKAKVFAAFQHDALFDRVYNDYYNTFLTLIEILSENKKIDGVTTKTNKSNDTVMQNLQNPMFPADQVAPALARIISSNPFVPEYYAILEQRLGHTHEVEKITHYFIG